MPRKYRSRLAKTQEAREKKDLLRYAFFTIGIIAFVLLVGIPFVIPRITAVIDQTSGRNSTGFNPGDTTPPPPPHLRDLPRYTSEGSVEVAGFTEAGATVSVVVNGRADQVIADAGGGFTLRVDLVAGDNKISAFAVDQAANESGKSREYLVTVDTEEPSLEVIKPQDGAIYFGNERNVQIEGQTESGARITINDRVAIVNAEGKFAMQVGLSEGGNTFTIKAYDEAGNTTEKSLTLSYTP